MEIKFIYNFRNPEINFRKQFKTSDVHLVSRVYINLESKIYKMKKNKRKMKNFNKKEKNNNK